MARQAGAAFGHSASSVVVRPGAAGQSGGGNGDGSPSAGPVARVKAFTALAAPKLEGPAVLHGGRIQLQAGLDA